MAKSDEEYELNLQKTLSLQLSALRIFSKANDPRAWGIVQHNLGCTYLALSKIRSDESQSVGDIESAIRHAELSFDVRTPEDSLQYWLASCRTLGEALFDLSTHSVVKDAAQYARRAEHVLRGAAAKISPSEHPHQWAEIQKELARSGQQESA